MVALGANKATIALVDDSSGVSSIVAAEGINTPEQVCCTNRFEHATGRGHLDLFRSGDAVDGADQNLLSRLMPHMGRAFQLQASYAEANGHWHAAQSSLNRMGVGVIFINHVGAPTFINSKATELVTTCHGIKVVDDGVYATRDGEKDAFQILINGVLASVNGKDSYEGGSIRLTCPKSAQPISALVMPLNGAMAGQHPDPQRPCATIILSSPKEHDLVSESVLKDFYGLSHSEAELAIGLINGQTIQEFAEANGKTVNTIRSLMKIVFRKTHTSRQAELLHAILTGPGMMRMD